MQKTKQAFQKFHICKWKKTPLEVSANMVIIGGEKYILGFHRDITERKKAEAEREKLINELKEALANIKTLSGMLPICASCKKIRDDKGYWSGVESYITAHSEAFFSHGICPNCEKKAYEELEKLKKENT